jgi:glutaminyl-tRNA synthetase
MAEDIRGKGRAEGTDFIRAIVARHNAEGAYGGRVTTRFPPEPNGFLHIGHAKSIVLNFGLALENDGRCHLRFDDTNPLTEDMKYVRAIQEDVRWLGYDWGEHLYFASDYFERLHECALILIRKGKAYVDSLSEEEIREYRGTVTRPGMESPYRNRSVEENLDLFRRMREGEFGDGEHVLRAKIDMAHPNMVMRDPVLYRIRHATHYRTGDEWCIYPLYDFTHCLSDAFEDITHSLCTLEFDNNREIYDWLLEEVGFQEPRPHQYEFARLNLDFTVMSKRKLLRLVKEGHVEGWDDPRMPTIAGLRRRGITPEAIRTFCDMIGVAKADNRVDMGKLEFAVRDHLNRTVPGSWGS